jgi:DNA-binding LytR/AlgR family response regulator
MRQHPAVWRIQEFRMADDDIETLLTTLMAEVKLLRAENAAILQGLGDESGVAMRVGVKVAGQEGDRLVLLMLADICFITTQKTGDDDTLAVCAADGKRYTNFQSLDVIAKLFAQDPRLMRTHKSFLVNLNRIRTVDNDGGGRILTFIGCDDSLTARVSGDNRTDFERRLGI